MARELQYRTYDELMSAVLSDWRTLDLEGFIDPGDYIKVAQMCNRQLGIKVQQEHLRVLPVCKGKVRMPNDFYALNYAFVCVDQVIVSNNIQGIQTEDVILDSTCSNPSPIPGSDFNTTCNPCNLTPTTPSVVIPGVVTNTNNARFTDCGIGFEVVQTINKSTHRFRHFRPLHLEKHKSIKDEFSRLGYMDEHVMPNAPIQPFFGDSPFYSRHWRGRVYRGYLKNGWLYVDFDEGHIFISYDGQMEDDDGNLLVVDHDILNEYYEYEIKYRILENMLISGEQVVNHLGVINERRRKAKIDALSIARAPDFQDMMELKHANERLYYKKYYSLFATPHFFVPSTGGWI